MVFNILFSLFVSVALSIVSYLLQPKPKKAQPERTKDLETPTADRGRPIPVVFGTVNITGANVIYHTARGKERYEVEL